MLNIVLLCQFGASTGMLAQNIRKAASNHGIEAVVNAYSASEIKKVASNADIILLGPQLRFRIDDLRKEISDISVPICVIDSLEYGMMDGNAILSHVLAELKK